MISLIFIIILIIILYVSFISITMQNLEVVASKLAKLWLFSLQVLYSSSIVWSFRHLRHISTVLPSQPRPFKLLYPSSISWPLRPLHLSNQKTARNAQVTAYSIWQQQQQSCLPLENRVCIVNAYNSITFLPINIQ